MTNSNYLKAVKFIYKHAKLWVIFSSLLAIVTGLIPLMIVWLSKEIVNEVSLLLAEEGIYSKTVIELLILQLLVFSLQKSIPNFQTFLNVKFEKKIDYELEKKVSEKASESPLSYFENHKFHNHLERIQFSKGIRLMSPIHATFQILRSIITVVSLAFYLVQYHWLLVVIVVIVVFPIIYIQIKFGKKQYLMHVFQTPEAREHSYLSALLSDRDSAREIRLFDLKDNFLDRWAFLFKKVSKEQVNLVKSREKANTSINVLSSFLYFIISLFLILIARNRGMQIGDFVSILLSVQMIEKSLIEIATSIGEIYSENLYISDLFNFLEFTDANQKKTSSITEKSFSFKSSLEFKNVSFKYPYSEQLALNNVSFKINYGEKIAIVGENGSGKTTLINCLMGLYPLSKGEILIDGTDVGEINIKELHKNITIIFQDYIKYNFSLEKNITLSKEVDQERIKKVISKTGVESVLRKLPFGLKTILGKIFLDGEDLSEGQWQKIAISRALYKGGEIFILDEPTSSLDPKAEMKVYEQFENLTENKTSIFISHRMASTKIADRILVFSDGHLIEEGTHKELITLNKEYAQLYNMQAKWHSE
ncbi:ABC transporter ATP-binding protein [Planomicrobium okeanokoites]|uniref:ABC transporter ATP-binding protein n=1 Tax=Planomicrobium okeanokoites TaxID=244 RepID=UPI0024935FF2|nr:ABC transporter ATP-binding protein [Planomicrobium okeanokoites]